jgi:ABC-type Fe3+-siderophore transport system permease subunit
LDPVRNIRVKNAHRIAIAGGALLIVGSLMDWVTAESPLGNFSKSGIEGDGIITAILGVIAVLTLTLSERVWPAAACGVIGGLVAIADTSNIRRVVDDVSGDLLNASVGVGLYVCILGGAGCVIGTMMQEKLAR